MTAQATRYFVHLEMEIPSFGSGRILVDCYHKGHKWVKIRKVATGQRRKIARATWNKLLDRAKRTRDMRPADDLMKPADVIRRRRQLDMKQAELAAALDIHRNTVSNWETGKVIVPRMAELAICELCRRAQL